MRLSRGNRLVLASHNQGKLVEFQSMMGDSVQLVSAGDLNLPEPEETGATFEENSLLKAKAAAISAQLPALADDSGLAVDGLDGQPGIYSARWAGPDKDFTVAFTRIQEELVSRGVAPPFRAAFVCVLSLVWPSGEQTLAEGRIEGHLVFPPRGEGGFGYDPIFVPDGDTRTFAEMARGEKALYSHRARAWAGMAPMIMPEGA